MADLGKAYVQIIPSAKGIKGSITNALKGESESAGKASGLGIAGGIKKAIVAAGIGAAVGKSLMESLLQGGALQQSLGGIETLFKDNADKVKAYARESYKTTGLSANAYMENVTGFSASLLQSLGGNTAKAAKIANTAMVDMADNSNKMGTQMIDIQNAYQGFAKQNYTMLDNLKLGYGGTKSEMERLLADAQKLTGVKYDINNLSDVYEAIHAIQGELGITGTTALEASETLTGSFSAMKAAFQDMLGNLALGENVKESMSNLAETISTFLFDNLIPMVGNILKSLPEAVVAFFDSFAPLLITKGGELLEKLAEGITTEIPLFFENLTSLTESFSSFFQEKGPELINHGGELIRNLIQGIIEKLPDIISAIGEIVANILSVFIESLPQLLITGGQLILEVMKGLIQNGPAILAALGGIVGQLIGVLISSLANFLAKGKEMIINLANGVIAKKNDLLAKVKTVVKNGWEAAKEAAKEFISIGWDIVSGIVKGIHDKINDVANKAREMVRKAIFGARAEADSHSPSRVMIKEGHNFGDGMIVGIVDKIKPAGKAAADMVKGAVNNAVQAVSKGQGNINNAFNSLADKVVKAQEKFGTASKKIHDDLIKSENQLTEKYNNEVNNRTKSLANWADWFKELPKQQQTSASILLKNLKQQNSVFEEWREGLNNLLSKGISEEFYAELKSKGVNAIGEIRALANASKEQLKQIQDEWNKRQDLARSQVQIDMKPEFAKLQQDIAAGRVNAKKELDKVILDYQKELGSIRDTTVRSLSKNGVSSEFVEKLIQDIRKVKPELESFAVIDPTKATEKMVPIIDRVAEIGSKVKEIWNAAIGNTVSDSDKKLSVLGDQGKHHGINFMTGLISGLDSRMGAFNQMIDAIQAKMRSLNNGGASNDGDVTPFAKGGIVTKPTLGLFGEAGAEAVLPIEKIDSIMASSINKAGYGGDLPESKLDKMIMLLGKIVDKDNKIVLDSGKLVSVTDRGLANKRRLAERGI